MMKTRRFDHFAIHAAIIVAAILRAGTVYAGTATAPARTDAKPALPALSDFKTVFTAAKTEIRKTSSTPTGRAGYLGVRVIAEKGGRLLVEDVELDSPAAKGGVQCGDALVKVCGQSVKTGDELRELLQSKAPGEIVKVTIERGRKKQEISVTLGATSRPMKLSSQRAMLGIQIGEPEDEGARVRFVTTGSPAATAGVKTGDLIVKVDNTPLSVPSRLTDTVGEKEPGDMVTLTLRRDGKDVDLAIKLTEDRGEGRFGAGGGAEPRLTIWKKDVYRLAVVGIEYPDVKYNAAIKNEEWEEMFFSTGMYVNKNNATGQPVHGSLNDYYNEQSCGALRVEGRVFDWIEVTKKRADYSQGTGTGPQRTSLLTEALDLIIKRDGNDAFNDFDGVMFIYAGDRFPTNRGGLYWPHRSSVTHRGKRWPYFICAEGGRRMGNISVFCHEFGHMLGLPDLYARPENPGSEGLGNWCAMSNQLGNGRPQHMGAWCKEQLGWIKPAVIDPTVKQKLILAPIEGSTSECYKVIIRPDGSEYLLLENRHKQAFDKDLPAEGLLIWRVVVNRPILEESHGVEGPQGPRVFLSNVPYPSPANNAFTPYTTPSSRAQLGGGAPVFITNIRRLDDGRVVFMIGYEFE